MSRLANDGQPRLEVAQPVSIPSIRITVVKRVIEMPHFREQRT